MPLSFFGTHDLTLCSFFMFLIRVGFPSCVFDYCPLLSQRDRNLDVFSRGTSPDMNLLLQDETFLHDQDFLYDWDDEYIALGTLLGKRLQFFPDRHASNLDLFAFQGRSRNLFNVLDDCPHLYLSGHKLTLVDAQLLFHDREDMLIRSTP